MTWHWQPKSVPAQPTAVAPLTMQFWAQLGMTERAVATQFWARARELARERRRRGRRGGDDDIVVGSFILNMCAQGRLVPGSYYNTSCWRPIVATVTDACVRSTQGKWIGVETQNCFTTVMRWVGARGYGPWRTTSGRRCSGTSRSEGGAVGTSFRGAMMAPTWVQLLRGRKGKLRAWSTTSLFLFLLLPGDAVVDHLPGTLQFHFYGRRWMTN